MKYRVTFEVYASATVTVDADSEEQAREKAGKKVWPTLCHECSHEIDISGIGELTHVEAVKQEGQADE
jgi:cytochrome c5